MSTNLVRIHQRTDRTRFDPGSRGASASSTDMLQLTKRTEYGLIALIHIADRAGLVVSVREIADHYPVPRRLLAEVVKDLAHAGLLDSQRGALGGYVLARRPEAITLGDVVVALEGAPLVASCESESDGVRSTCDVEPVCPIRSPLHRLREGIWRLMERTTLRSLCSTGPLVELGLDGIPEPLGTAELPLDARVEPRLPTREHSLESTHGTSTANHS
jgi:Rrf2 family nitric oxide-sensitive transcriptional repressor